MTHSSREWRESALSTVEDTTAHVVGRADELATTAAMAAHDLHDVLTVPEAEFDRTTARDEVREAESVLKATAHEWFDLAYDVRKLRSGSTLRNLRGKEPVGYSKRDGGGAHDAYYGMKSLNAGFSRHVVWPLKLSEWNKTTADPTLDGVDPVTAEGTKKYTTTIADRRVAVVVDERGMSPI